MLTNPKPIKVLGSNRVIFLNGDIDTENVGSVVERLFQLDVGAKKDTLLVLNTDGGNVSDGLYLINVFKLLRSPVAILVPSSALSIGACVFAAGFKGKRIVMPGSVVMMHGASYELTTSPHRIHKSEIEFQEKQEQYIANLLKEGGFKHPEASLASEYTYYTGQEIINVGIADIMINSLDELHKVINI